VSSVFDPATGPNASDPIPATAGIGLRFPHHREVRQTRPAIAWLEVHSENYFAGGATRRALLDIRRDYALSLHGVGLSLGSAEGLDPVHLAQVARLAREIEPGLISEHLSWSIVDGNYLGDLLPLPMTAEALEVVCRHVAQTQEMLRRQILIENPSTYLQCPQSVIPEWEFLTAVVQRTGCGLLCDVNNIYVSASNHGWDAAAYLRALPAAAIGEIHLAGHTLRTLSSGAQVRIDDHGSRVSAEVWDLYQLSLRLVGPKPTLIEWDSDLPPLEVLLDEAARASRCLEATRGAHERAA
jgi:uncharacterized protein (UPF0276 family)